MPISQKISDYRKLDNDNQKEQLRKKSSAFYDESTKMLKAAVQETNSKRVAFAGFEFKPENCYGAEKSWLWRIESGQTRTDDPMYECRVALVGDRNGDKDRIDRVAAVGHPNEKGAEQYFSAIKAAIEKTAPEFLPKVEEFSFVSPTTRSLGESFEVDYTISDKGELGLKQVALWRTQEKDKWPEWPENPIQTTPLAGETGPLPGSFTDSPSAPGKYWYGVHVVDNAGNWNDERNSNIDNTLVSKEPIEVEVKDATAIAPTKLLTVTPKTDQFSTSKPSTPKVLHRFDCGCTMESQSLAFSPDGREFAAACNGGFTVLIWDIATETKLHELKQDDNQQSMDGVQSIAFSPDGSKLATASKTTVCIWSVTTGAELQRFNLDGYANTLAFSPDGSKLAVGSERGRVNIWDMAEASLSMLDNVSSYDQVIFSPDGSKLATDMGNAAGIWDAATCMRLRTLNTTSNVKSIAFSPDGSKLATVSYDTPNPTINSVVIWDVAAGAELNKLNYDPAVASIAFSPDGSMLATASWDKTARVWDIATWSELYRLNVSVSYKIPDLEKRMDSVIFAAFSPDGSMLATAGYNGNILIWGVTTENK
jgi:WD40 repeat protein